MTPTPSPHSSFQPHFRFRRSRNAVPYTSPPHNTYTPITQTPETPLVDQSGSVVWLEQSQDGADPDIEDQGDEESAEEQEDMSDFEEGIEDHEQELEGIEEVPMDIDAPFDPAALGLKEIGNLASWTVSSCKPGCGVEALRDEDTALFWQSDGPQPHHLNIHFSRLVSIRSIRIYLDFEADESYTPTRITLLAGTGYHDLIPFSALEFTQPKGWIDVPLDHVGGGEDGKTLRAFLVQVRVVENHQNGKDTHVRGLKVFARDEKIRGALDVMDLGQEVKTKKSRVSDLPIRLNGADRGFLIEPSWMGDPELR